MSPDLTVIVGDALGKLRELPSESVHCCVTSPPYWGLRDYGTAEWEGGRIDCAHQQSSFRASDKSTLNGGKCVGPDEKIKNDGVPFLDSCGKCGAKRIDAQLGLEKTPEEYVAKMLEVFREVKRVLRADGTLWLNLGDSYANTGSGSGADNASHRGEDCGNFRNGLAYVGQGNPKTAVSGLKPKDLCGIPWRVAFALQADGWYLRSDIIWAKPNAMPESVADRPTKAHEYVFLLTKSSHYFYDAEAIKERYAECTINDSRVGVAVSRGGIKDYAGAGIQNPSDVQARIFNNLGTGRNKRSVWTVATAPYPKAHFATYPPDLIKPCILAGTSAKGCCAKCGAPWERIVEKGDLQGPGFGNYNLPKAQESKDDPMVKGRSEGWWPNHRFESKTIGWQPTCECSRSFQIGKTIDIEYPCSTPETIPCTLLDPFAGSGTTGAVALELGRSAVLIELSSNYAQLIRERCAITPGLALS